MRSRTVFVSATVVVVVTALAMPAPTAPPTTKAARTIHLLPRSTCTAPPLPSVPCVRPPPAFASVLSPKDRKCFKTLVKRLSLTGSRITTARIRSTRSRGEITRSRNARVGGNCPQSLRAVSRRNVKALRGLVDAVGMFGIAPVQVSRDRGLLLVRWPVPIVATRRGIIPLGLFALLFVAFSGHSKPSMLAACALLGGFGGVVSLIVHELGHVSVARRLSGVRPEKVSVMSLGAAAHFEGSYRSGREQVR